MFAINMFGYMGKLLRVNLTEEQTRQKDLETDIAKRFVGGRGLGAKILFDEINPETDPLEPENKLVIATGVVTGIPFAGNSRYAVMAKSPLTGIWGEAHAGGYFGPELKFSGYDAIVVEGRAPNPVYLWIHNGNVEIRDAKNVWGKTSGETIEFIRKEIGDNRIRVACIGPGGENLVKYACIISDFHRAAGRTGMGAVMGSKRLKAIAVRGTLKTPYADEEKVMELAKAANKEVWKGPSMEGIHKFGTAGDLDNLSATGRLPTKAFRKSAFDHADNITGETMAKTILIKRDTCYACPIACIRVVETKGEITVDPIYGGPEYETAAAFGSLCMNDNLVAVAKANELCNKYAIDTISTGVAIAFAMECFEKGLLTIKDTGGINLAWGNHQAILQSIQKIAKREGIGNLLAEGVKRASLEIGKGSEDFALHVKGQELPMHEPRGKKGVGLSCAISNRGACHLQCEHDDRFEDQKYLSADIGLDDIPALNKLDASKQKANLVKTAGDLWSLYDSLIVCKFPTYPGGGVQVRTLVNIVNAATGWDVDSKDLMMIGERAFNLTRAFNVREGITRKDDVLPARFMEPLPDGPYKGETISLDQMLNYYYEIREWDLKTGIPTKEKLQELELGYVTDQLQR